MLSLADADLVARDRDLPDLALLLDPDRLATRLNRTLGEHRMGAVRVTYLRYKPGLSCLAACRAEVDARPVDFIAAVYGARARGKFQKALSRPSVPGALGQGRFALDDARVLISGFPNDWRLGRLASVVSSEGLGQLGARLGAEAGAALHITTLRHNPERRFVGQLIANTTPIAAVRCYTAEDFGSIAAKTRALASRGPLRLATRLTRLHRQRVLAFEWIHGDVLDDLIRRQSASPDVLERVGRALAHLHGQDAPGLTARRLAEDVAALSSLARHVGFLHPPVARLATELAERVAARLVGSRPPLRPLHGDFYARQVVVQRDTVGLIDLDEAALGDPAIDLARFRADLESAALVRALPFEDVDARMAPLLEGYRLTAGAVPERLNLWTAAQLFRLAAHPFRRREVEWPDTMRALLERARMFVDRDTGDRAARVPSPLAVNGQDNTTTRPDRDHLARVISLRPEPVRISDPFGVTSDASMPFIHRALDPAHMARRFSRELCGVGERAQIEVLAITVTRHKPGLRCLITYDLAVHDAAGEGGPMRVVGKVRAQSTDTSLYDLLETLWTGSFGGAPDDQIAIPEPLGIIADVHMVVQRWVSGTPLGQRLEGADGMRLARRCAEAIAKLHGVAAPTRRRHTVDDELRILATRLIAVMREHPEWRERIERLLDACGRLARRVHDEPTCGIHRDFYPDQLLVDGDRLYVTDLDLYREGPPALDVGNFVAHVEEYSLRRFGDAGRLADRSDMLIERYLQLSDRTTRESIEIWTMLSLARHIAISRQFAERRPFTTAILDHCERRALGETARDRASSVAAGPVQGARG